MLSALMSDREPMDDTPKKRPNEAASSQTGHGISE